MGNKFIQDSVSVLGNRVFIIIITFATSILLARYLGPEGKGLMTALLVYPALLVSLAELGIRQSATYLIGKREYSEQDIISQVLLFLVTSSTIMVFIVAYLFTVLDNPDFTFYMVLMAIFYIPVKLATSYSQGIFLGRGEINKFNITSRLQPTIDLALIIVFVVIFNLSVAGAVLATFVASLIVALYALRELTRISSIKLHFDWIISKQMISMGIVYAMALFILNLNYKIDVVLLERLTVASEIGQYSIGVGIAELIWLLPSTLGVVIFSHSSNAKDPAGFSKGMMKLFRVTFILSIICGLLLFFASEYLIPLVYGAAFAPSVEVLRILLPGIILMTAFKVLNMDLAGKGKPQVSLIAFMPAVIINIVLNVLWIPLYGANGAALASTISYSLGSLIFLALYSRILRIPMLEIIRFRASDFDFIQRYVRDLKKQVSWP
jgi:O-antigen/teichoic acid export membrane protein